MTDVPATETAKAIVLERIRSALAAAIGDHVVVDRRYERAPLRACADLERFADAVGEYRAQVLRISEADIAATIASLLPAGARVVVPEGLPRDWVTGVDLVVDDDRNPLTLAALDTAAAVVTGCALGIAATGTIVLDAGPRQGRRAVTLVPDHHICVVFAEQVVDTLPQAFAILTATRPLTLISGPSATSDIELDRVEGVHGPRTLDVLLIG